MLGGVHGDSGEAGRKLARRCLAAQAVGGAGWWLAVSASLSVRRWTLGGWDPWVLVVPDVGLFVVAAAAAAITGNRWLAAASAAWTAGVTVVVLAHGLVTGEAGWGAVAMVPAAVGSAAAAAVLWSGRVPMGWFFLGPFAFREADGRSPWRQLRRSLGQLVVFWSAFFVAVPIAFSWGEHRLHVHCPALDAPAVGIVGAAAWCGAAVIGLWACATMALVGHGTPLPSATAPRLVIAGPYRLVRNPMAVAGAIQTSGAGLWFGSWTVVAIAVAGAVAWNELIRPAEEGDLRARFGPSFDAYCGAVRCWIPRLRPAVEVVAT